MSQLVYVNVGMYIKCMKRARTSSARSTHVHQVYKVRVHIKLLKCACESGAQTCACTSSAQSFVRVHMQRTKRACTGMNCVCAHDAH